MRENSVAPVLASHTRAVESAHAVTIRDLSGLNTADVIQFVCPLRSNCGAPVLASHTFAVMSVLPFLAAIPTYTWIIDRLALRARLDTVVGGRASVHPLSLRPRDDLHVTGTR